VKRRSGAEKRRGHAHQRRQHCWRKPLRKPKTGSGRNLQRNSIVKENSQCVDNEIMKDKRNMKKWKGRRRRNIRKNEEKRRNINEETGEMKKWRKKTKTEEKQ